MTLAVDIIKAAYREGNLVALGVTPSTAQMQEALNRLNRLTKGILGFKMGENITDWPVPVPQRTAPVAANFPQFPGPGGWAGGSAIYPYPPNNKRIVWGGVTITVYMPEKPNPGSQIGLLQGSGAGDSGTTGAVLTLNGNGRTIQGADTQTFTFNSAIGNTPFKPVTWFYRDDLGDWVLITNMTLGDGTGATAGTDSLPYPDEFDDFFICALSKRLAPAYNKIVARETIQTALDAEANFLARYRQPTDTVYGSDQFPRSYQSYISGNWWW